jgi:hypothetical protein
MCRQIIKTVAVACPPAAMPLSDLSPLLDIETETVIRTLVVVVVDRHQ